jgi:hypothetical protein
VLDLHHVRVTEAGMETLRKALPGCDIIPQKEMEVGP